MSTKDPHAALRKRLAKCNLGELGRLSGVPDRTLRRIRNGTEPIRASTLAKFEQHIEASRVARNETKARALRAAETRKANAA